MRKLFFVLVAVLWIVAGIQVIQNVNRGDEEQIVEAFSRTNCMDANSEVLAEGSLKGYRTHDKQVELLENVANKIGVESSWDITERQDGSRNILELSREAAQAHVVLRVICVESEEENAVVETSQYVTAQISLYDDLECAVLYKEELERALQEVMEEPKVSIQFYGELQGSLAKEERRSLINQLLEDLSAKERRSFEEEGVYTVYAYTELAKGYETIRGEKINVTVAVTYDEAAQRTRLYLATPVLKGDY